MKNRFSVLTCRFHVKDENKLLITGWFYEDSMGENRLLVCLDKKKLPITIEEVNQIRGNLKTSKGLPVTKQYMLCVKLPKDWKSCRRLEVKNFYRGVGGTAFSLSTYHLKKRMGKLHQNIERSAADENGFQVFGWYIDTGSMRMRMVDEEGREYPTELVRVERTDVRRSYPECTKEEVVGFQAVYRGEVPKKLRVCFEDGGRQSSQKVIFYPSAVEKKVLFAENAAKKTRTYYEENGAAATAVRIFDKLTRREIKVYNAWLKKNSPSQKELAAQREREFPFSPKISIVVPLYKTPEKYLKALIESVREQSYGNWELCLSDGSGKHSPLTAFLKHYEREDGRIRVVHNDRQLQISDNTNEALKIATGDFIAFADHDDLLAPDVLYECVKALNEDPSIEVLYTDEDKIDMKGKEHFMPHFKPDFNIDMLRSGNYICHMFFVKREIYEKVGMLQGEYDGAQDFDFVLRCIEQTERIRHIPKILYHWRAHKNSTADNPDCKNYAYEAGAKAVQAHYDRLGIRAEASQTEHKGLYRTKYLLDERPLISVIIPNRDHRADLEKCIRSLETENQYENLEYIIVENNSQEEETFAYYKCLEEENAKAKVVYWEGKGFNYSALNNYGARHASGKYLLFLNNDTEIKNKDCIEELLSVCMREDVGAVGARLYYGDGTIQHAGVIVGIRGSAGHVFTTQEADSPGYFGRAYMMQNYSAVTAACMLVDRAVFEQVNGFDESFAVALNDVDLCLRIRKAGYLIVYDPYAELYHYESKSRGYDNKEENAGRFRSEVKLFQKRWKSFLEKGDPCYNPNLTLEKNDFTLEIAQKKRKDETKTADLRKGVNRK